jgi:uncharacterized repeat protein (TIGR03803 family)
MPNNKIARAPCIALAVFAAQCVAYGQQFQILYSFTGGSDGAYPQGSLIQSGTTLYGMTTFGGTGHDFSGKGTLFAFDTSTGVLSTLHQFTGGTIDGGFPYGSPTLVDGALYGMTNSGGANGFGTIFSYNTLGNSYTVAISFAGSDGGGPQGSLIQSGNFLYGMGSALGAAGNGTVFAFDTGAGTNATLHTFTGAPTDGKFPDGSLIQSGQILYGMSQLGGSSNLGAIFSFNLSTSKQTLLHSFTGGITDGSSPRGSLLLSGNTLFGMTEFGGQNNLGAIFAYDLTTGNETILHSFAGGSNDGANPLGSLIISGDTLYGMTLNGGNTPYNAGTIFSFDVATGQFTLLHSFDPAQHGGEDPYGDLLLSGNTLYGMTNIGGDNPYGAIFSMTLPEPSSLALLTGGLVVLVKRRCTRGTFTVTAS